LSSSALGPGARRALPWVVWGAAALAAIPLALHVSGFGVAPAVSEVRKVTLGSPRTVRVAAVLAMPGDVVKAGQVLVRLDATDVNVDIEIARAELERLEFEVSSREVSLRDTRSETASRLASEAERSALDASRLNAEDERDRSELAQLDEQITREQKLVDEGLTRSDNLNALKLRRAALGKKVQEFGRAVTEARRAASGSAKRLGDWRGAPGSGGNTGSAIDRQLAPARAAVAAQTERVKQLELVKERLELRAPSDGKVAEVFAHADEMVAAGAPVISVLDDHPRRAIAYVDQRWASRIRPGDRVRLLPSDHSAPPSGGTVKSVGAAITELPVRFRLIPTEPLFGREAFIDLDAPAALPGQAFSATFHRPEGAGS